MKIFVTGANGFIGKVFMKRLLAEAVDDLCVWSLVRTASHPDDSRIVELTGDLQNVADYHRELLDCDYLFHLAANATFGNDIDYDQVNLFPTVKMLDILKQSDRLKNFVFTSTIGAVDRTPGDRCLQPLTAESIPCPRSRYGESKLRAEQAIRESGLPYTIIRPTWVYGSDMRTGSHINRFVSMVMKNHPITCLALPGKVSLIHVHDLAQALVRCIGCQHVVSRTYFAEIESLSLGDIFALIARKLGIRRSGYIIVPPLAPLIRRIHSKIPLTAANLFVDYLLASDHSFRKDFSLNSPLRFEEGIVDVISSNVHMAGYWVITGANSGIGLALARRVASMGKNMLLVDKNMENLNGFDKAVVLCADLSSEQGIDAIYAALSGRKIAVLINNAGIGVRGAFRDTPIEAIKRIVSINALAPILLTRRLLDNLIAHESVIVNIASSIAYNPLPFMSLYSATKSCISNWSESLTYELRKTNRIITFSPSGTLTGFQQTAGVKVLNDGKGLMAPEDVAEQIVLAISSNRRVVILGFPTKILLLVSRLIPRSLNITLWGRLFEKYR